MRIWIITFGFVVSRLYAGANSDERDEDITNDTIKVTVVGSLGKVSPYYLSVAVSPQIVLDGLIADLASSKRFITLAKGLSPAILRVGGSAANFLTYDPSSTVGSDPVLRKGQSWGDVYDEETDLDFDVREFVNFTMTAEEFGHLKDLANSAGFEILFDLNQFYRTPEGTWDPSNAFDIMKGGDYSFLWQLGNEPNSYNYNYHYNLTGTMGAADFKLLKEELQKFFKNPAIVGPDVTRPRFPLKSSNEFLDTGAEEENSIHMKFLKEFLANLEIELSAVTMHHYYLPGTGVSVANFTDLETLDALTWQIPQIVALRDEYCPDTPIWFTETSSCTGGGAADLSNAYVAGFLWLDKLGLAAAMGVELLARQTLFQKRYALIDSNYVPYPDYWLSLLFKRLVGDRVLELNRGDSTKTTRLYSHCQKPNSTSYEPGNVVIFGLNVDNSSSIRVKIEGMSSEHSFEEYLLQPPEGDLQSKQVMLNGKLLQMTSDDELPELLPLLLSEQEFQVPAVSFGFWVVKKANVSDCI